MTRLVPLVVAIAFLPTCGAPSMQSHDRPARGTFLAPAICRDPWRPAFGGGVIDQAAVQRALWPVVDALRARVCWCMQDTRAPSVEFRFRLTSTPTLGQGSAELAAARGSSPDLEACIAGIRARFPPWQLGSCADPEHGQGTIVCVRSAG
jgi:hypothetical protein